MIFGGVLWCVAQVCKHCGGDGQSETASTTSYNHSYKHKHLLPPGSCPPLEVVHPILQLHLLLFWTHICHCHPPHTAGPRLRLYWSPSLKKKQKQNTDTGMRWRAVVFKAIYLLLLFPISSNCRHYKQCSPHISINVTDTELQLKQFSVNCLKLVTVFNWFWCYFLC